MYYIERKSNFHPNWTISKGWSSNGYKTKEEAELWLKRAELHQMSCVQATSFSFRVAQHGAVA